CNIHFHSAAEHRGPGFTVMAGKDDTGGFACNDAKALSAAEKAPVAHGACHGLASGQTIEVHWVFSSCDVKPGKGLEACSSAQCASPVLRVE
ncbi:delta-class carbonic anhydrase, partial [Acinetobacter baumannii]